MPNPTFLQTIFRKDYHPDDIKSLYAKIFPDINYYAVPQEEELTESKAQDAKKILRFGDITLADGKQITLYEVELQNGKSITRNRVGLRNLLHNFVVSGLVDGILATYYNKQSNDWRLSFISKNAYWDDEQGIVKDETHPKRYTFVLGKNESIKTAVERIQPLISTVVDNAQKVSLTDLLKAFSVQKISKEFFTKYKSNYLAFAEFLGTRKLKALFVPNREDISGEEQEKETKRNISNFTKKLLGRVVFLYFLQKKGWLGVSEDDDWGNGQRDFVSQLFDNLKDKKSFYQSALAPLFFDTLNKKRKDDLFTLTNTKVPFLNGGLFDKADGEPIDLKFEPELFENLFSFFNEYNFTIDENSPDDLDIGVDPEMLGLIFENLLEENRNKTGAFYTPKEVVHYMCKESISLYLQKKFADKLKADELKVLDAFIKQTDISTPGLIKEHADDIQHFLNTVKICDPAIGSGAFPLGIVFEILRIRKEIFPHLSKQKNFDYRIEKLDIMRKNIYGVDIDGGAVDISRLRFWLSLIVDEEVPSPLPNLDYKIMQGDSLMESFEQIPLLEIKNNPRNLKVYEPIRDLFGNIKSTQPTINSQPFDTEELEKKVKDFFIIQNSDEKKSKHKEIDDEVLKHIETCINSYELELLQEKESIVKDYNKDLVAATPAMKLKLAIGPKAKKIAGYDNKLNEVTRIKNRLIKIAEQAERPYFLWHLFFKDVFDKGGFDIVIGNPPYGVPVSDELKEEFGLSSKDSYGVFMAHAIKKLMKNDGVCTFIVSDTWLTIKSHLPLRKLFLQKQLHKIIRLPGDTFGATVNTCIYIQSNTDTNEKLELIAADLTNISPQKRLPEFRDRLFNLEKYVGIYTPDFAVYKYPQQLININSNIPVFVASPKLFALMNDTDCLLKTENDGTEDEYDIRVIPINDRQIELVRFGDIADIKQGLATGDNHYYLYQNPNARGNYKDITLHKQFLLTDKDLDIIHKNDVVRLKIIENGIHQSKDEKGFDNDCWFGGRYIVPYDKGGESDTDIGWLPNYFVPTNYFIDWSRKSIKRMKTYTIAQRIVEKSEKKPITEKSKITNAAVLRSMELNFIEAITFSFAGLYSPTFRFGSGGPFDHASSNIYQQTFTSQTMIAILSSKLIRFLARNSINHTVNFGVDDMKELPVILSDIPKMDDLVFKLIENQKLNLRYDYQSNEQKQIDALVYEAYGLNKHDINEVETWYARRYPKMAAYADMVSIKELVEKIEDGIVAEDVYARRVKELIKIGENKRAEYKSTLRFCLKEKSPQAYVEHSALKTIAAFLNSDGGTLLIGVDDDGNILGLADDYSTFGKNKNYQDEWVKHFDNITSYAFGNAIMNNVSLNFAIVEEKVVAIVDVRESTTHIFMKNKSDKNRKQFYIRRNGSTVELDAEEIIVYVNQKWV